MTKAEIGRLTLREEGDNWNAYYAPSRTSMNGAIFLGSIRMAAVVKHPVRKQAFMDLMTGIVSDIINDLIGRRPTWAVTTAPEHERSGHG